MTTFLVCPLNGCLPPDNGANTTPANNQVPTVSDAVGAASGIIGSTSSTQVNVTTPANFPTGTWFTIPTRKEKFFVSVGGANPLTVVRAAENNGGGPVTTFTPSGSIAQNDVILTGLDANGKAPHCPLCGTAMVVHDPAYVTTLTGVAAGSQHPADVDETYVTQADSALAQQGTTNTPTGFGTRVTHAFGSSPGYWSAPAADGEPATWNTSANSFNRGDTKVTPSTINTTVGP